MSEEEFDEDLGIKKGTMIKGRVDYVVLKVLGEGGFGSVFLVHDGNKECAMKVEKKIETRRHSKLKMEISILKTIAKLRKDRQVDTDKSTVEKKPRRENHFTDIIDRGREPTFFFMVIDLVGKSLADLKMLRQEKVFSLGTGLGVGIQCLEAIEDLHEVQFIHRDIKPANYACGRPPNTHVIYILDFGIARKVMNKDQQLKTPRERVGFKGTVRFASLACHRNQELARKDDVECWLYMMMDLLVKPGLPWRKESDKDVVGEMKKNIRDEKTQVHKDFYGDLKSKPKFHLILTYLEGLQYVDTPDYKYIYNLLREIGKENNVDVDAPYDWEVEQKK
ncbi:unnamed protein product [Bursaphelenchus xylophilus]|uniref:(pine wood nematode) hypothetical protein n=1 Tax=Bursaphelenchus xylophilus TaxID=6326 RepID=A0A1I7RK16_BURXY|nr:unnamed protein product [Bursaphelenchus xylophilus]CAG9131573.1 unnamed protein product [Bursaphelenchus xylophilus]